MPRLGEAAAIKARTFRLIPSPETAISDLFALAAAAERAVADGAHGEPGGVPLGPGWVAGALAAG